MSDEFSPWDAAFSRPPTVVREKTFTAPNGKQFALSLKELGPLESFKVNDLMSDYCQRHLTDGEPLLGPDGTQFTPSRGVFQLCALLETMQVNEPKRGLLDWLAIAERVNPLWREIVAWMVEFVPKGDDEGNSPRSGQATGADTGPSSTSPSATAEPTPN